jgi:hypothetical protein
VQNSGSGTTGTVTATLPAQQSKTTAICGFSITSGGATGAIVVQVTVTNVFGGTMTFTYEDPSGASSGATPLNVPFNPCIPATTQNQTIVVTLPALGAGVTAANVNAWGIQY